MPFFPLVFFFAEYFNPAIEMKLGRTEILKRGKAEKKTIRKYLLNINFIPKTK